jgi:EF hand
MPAARSLGYAVDQSLTHPDFANQQGTGPAFGAFSGGMAGERAGDLRDRSGRSAMKLLLGSTGLALTFGLGVCLSGPAAGQQLQYACDANDDGFVDAQESKLCTDAEFDKIAAGESVLTEEVLKAKSEGGKGMPTFAEADQNGDGQISREEWGEFSGQRFAGAAEASGGRMTAEEYNAWRQKGMQNVQP